MNGSTAGAWSPVPTLARWWSRLRRLTGPRLIVWHHSAYRLPIGGLEAGLGIEPRRADLVKWFLLERGTVGRKQVRTPPAIAWSDLARVHQDALLESLGDPRTLARVYAADPDRFPVDEVLRTTRLACGGTLAAARDVLAEGGTGLNLLGGFHHAAPDRAAGLSPVNDIAVAIAALRAEGLRGTALVLDLDAHPPDGTADCLRGQSDAWIGSIDAQVESWEVPEAANLRRLKLAPGSGDAAYLAALETLLHEMPHTPAIAFVIAGGDVLAGDRVGRLGLSLAGARRRDLRLAEALAGTPSVWLPGGGYHPDAWRVLAGSALALAEASRAPIPDGADPVESHFARLSGEISAARLGGPPESSDFALEDVADALGIPGAGPPRLLDFYSAEGIEYAFYRFGVLDFVRRLGYADLAVRIDRATSGDRLRLTGTAGGAVHVLVEVIVERSTVGDEPVLYVNWLSLRDPRASFSPRRPRLPGQDVPGLGLAREAVEMLARMAHRIGAHGVAFRPAYFHTAYAARARFRFVDPARQGRFEALVRDLSALPLLEATAAVSEGRVLLNGEPYAWEADEMVFWLDRGEVAPAQGRGNLAPSSPGPSPPPRFSLRHLNDS